MILLLNIFEWLGVIFCIQLVMLIIFILCCARDLRDENRDIYERELRKKGWIKTFWGDH